MINDIWKQPVEQINYAQTTIDNDFKKAIYKYIKELKIKDTEKEISNGALIRLIMNKFDIGIEVVEQFLKKGCNE